uniref:Uncharacterized protein n=1 Tax=Anopheles dirus TaxID=7168 RepID=A0A182NXT9_9DIPT
MGSFRAPTSRVLNLQPYAHAAPVYRARTERVFGETRRLSGKRRIHTNTLDVCRRCKETLPRQSSTLAAVPRVFCEGGMFVWKCSAAVRQCSCGGKSLVV